MQLVNKLTSADIFVDGGVLRGQAIKLHGHPTHVPLSAVR